jgi:hypothetical protein
MAKTNEAASLVEFVLCDNVEHMWFSVITPSLVERSDDCFPGSSFALAFISRILTSNRICETAQGPHSLSSLRPSCPLSCCFYVAFLLFSCTGPQKCRHM